MTCTAESNLPIWQLFSSHLGIPQVLVRGLVPVGLGASTLEPEYWLYLLYIKQCGMFLHVNKEGQEM